MFSPIAERLHSARYSHFVGRAVEQHTFLSILTEQRIAYNVLFLFGPSGIGKTTLLYRFMYLCKHQNIPVIYLDARNIEPTPEAFLESLRHTVELGPHRSPFEVIASHSTQYVILLDTYETIAPLDDWFRETFLPQLPENVLVVIAAHHPPGIAWRADLGWQKLIRQIPLRNLSPDEGRGYLSQRSIPADQHPAILDFTHGHPLALSLIADMLMQHSGVRFQPDETPDIIRALMNQLISKVPSPAHRAVLEVCSLVRLTTESLLTDVLAMPDVHEMFEWLGTLSCIDAARGGLFVHDLAREVLAADLRWRNPDWYLELRRRVRAYYTKMLQQTSDQAQQQRVIFDYIYLHRDNTLVRPFFEWQTSSTLLADRLHTGDHDRIIDMVAKHEGEESAQLAAGWLKRQPQGVVVIRDSNGQLVGWLLTVFLHELNDSEAIEDPAILAARTYLNDNAPPRSGEKATMFRFWMALDTYQDVSQVQSLILVQMIRHYLTTPGLAFTFLVCADPDFWMPASTYAGFSRIEAVDFQVGKHRYGVYGHDWRTTPPLTWLAHVAEKETAISLEAPPHVPTEDLVVLSKPAFVQAVRDALRDFAQSEALHRNPLMRSRLIVEKTGIGASLTEHGAALKALLLETIDMLRQSPRQVKLYRALYHTYIQPSPTQEQAAELLDVPFSSFRRHLKAGMNYVIETLWLREINSL